MRLVQRALGGLGERGRVELTFGLPLGDVGDALGGEGHGEESRLLAHGVEGRGARRHVGHREPLGPRSRPERGLNLVVDQAAPPEQVAHAVGEEGVQIGEHRAGVTAQPLAVERDRAAQQRLERQRQVGLEQDAQRALRGAPQPERIARAGGHETQAEDPGQRVEAVGEPAGDAHPAARQRVVGAGGGVLVVDRLPDRLRIALLARVDASHHALQRGELLDHLGDQVGLEQARGAGGLLRLAVPAEGARHLGGEDLQAFGLGRVAAQLLVEREGGQRAHAVGQRRAPVLLPEEARVGQAGRHHPLVAGAHAADGVVGTVHHGEEDRQHDPLALDGEGALVVAQAGGEHLARQLQEGGIELAFEHAGDLADGAQLAEQRQVGDERAAARRGPRRHLLPQPAHALGEADLDAALAQGRQVLGRRRDRERRRRERRVPHRLAPGRHAEELHRHELAVEQRHHAVHRAHPRSTSRNLAGAAPPPHGLRPRDAEQDARQQLGEDVARRQAHHRAPRRHVLALVGAHPFELRGGEAEALREPLGRLGGRAVGREGGLHGRAGHQLLHVGRARRHPLEHEHQAARREARLHFPRADAAPHQLLEDARRQLAARPLEHPRRDLLATHLEQQLAAGSRRGRAGGGRRGGGRLSHGPPPAPAARPSGAAGSRAARGSPRTPGHSRRRGRVPASSAPRARSPRRRRARRAR